MKISIHSVRKNDVYAKALQNLFIITAFTFIILLLFSLTGCDKIVNEPISKQGFAFDTLINITLYEGGSPDTLEKCFDLCDRYEDLFSKTKEGSDIYRINHSEGKEITVSEETIKLLERALYYNRLSEGSYDITIEPVVLLWGFEDKENKITGLPDEKSLKEALSHVSSSNIVINSDKNTVRLNDQNARIDAGSIAKGYISDRLKEELIKEGITSAIIDLGGNITTLNGKPLGNGKYSDFKIGIKAPEKNNLSQIALSLDITDRSVVTSGIYERFLTIDKVDYHHILDPFTGYPADTDILSVTVICDESTDADALSTTCLLSGEKKALSLIDSINDTEAVIIKKDGTISLSAGADRYVKDLPKK
ncbi:MAG: FAD:protein FMN transferase [Lachnospiraceae bacterium]|nr:FAD:protein FMN transferase [Lachnospiraceae bacterium]